MSLRSCKLLLLIASLICLVSFSFGFRSQDQSPPGQVRMDQSSPSPSATPTLSVTALTSPSPSATEFISPAMVTAIGSLWPLALVIVIAILIVVLRKPLRMLLENIVERSGKADKFELKAGLLGVAMSQETIAVERRAEDKSRTEEEEDKPETPSEKPEPGNQSSAARGASPGLEVKTPSQLFLELVDAFHERNREKIEEIYKTMQEVETNDEERISNEAYYLYIKFSLGDPSAINRLRELTKREGGTAPGYVWIGHAYEGLNEFEKAADAFQLAAQALQEESEKASYIAKAADCYARIGKEEKAIDMIQKEIGNVQNVGALSELYKGLASLYKLLNRAELRALALEKALEYSPDNSSLLFDTAYAFGEIDQRGLSLLHYRSIVAFNPKHTSALNNLGVAYENLEMPIFSVNAYKEASKLNYTLPSANLAYRLMNAGFAGEAKDLLNTAKQQDDVHPNIGSAISALAQKETDEEKMRQNILNSALHQQRFFREYASALFISRPQPHNFDGIWLFPEGIEVEVTTTASGGIEANWTKSTKKYQFSGAVTKQSAKIAMYKMNYGYLEPTRELGFEKEIDGYAYLSEDGQKMEIMTVKENAHTSITLTKKTPEEKLADEEHS